MPIKSFLAQPTPCRECGRTIQGINRGVVCPSCNMPICRSHQLGQPNFICHHCKFNQEQFHNQFPTNPLPNNISADSIYDNFKKADSLYQENRVAEADEIITKTIFDLFLSEDK